MNFKDNKYYKLKEICNFQEGYVNPSQKKPEYFGGDIKWLRATDLNNSYVYDTSRKLSKIGFESAGKSALLFHPNTIAISKSGTIGRLGILKDYMCGNRAVINIDINNDDIDINYLFYWLRHKQEYIKDLAVGSVQRNLYISILEDVKIKYRPLHEQKKIAAICKNIDKKIENNKKMNKTLEEMAQAIYKNWFVYFEPFQDEEFFESELGMIPEGWEVGNINDFVNVQNGYGFSSKLFSDEGNIGVIKIKNITENNTVNISDTQYISKKTAEETNKRYLIKPNSILIAMTGAKVGKIGIVPETNTTLYLNQRVGMLKPKINGGIEYSYIALMTDYYQNVIKNKARGSAQANISATAIGSIKVVIPPKKILKKYANIIKPILNKISSNLNENRSLKELRDSLLPKLMSGEIRVPLDEDEKEVN
jgi:type I restriction enzyme S subunit